ncbi:MAG: HAMP domain-containing protein [Acidobacteria bacterium]|nr:HAMP domain-containing protein [Acidobacteriota bacterium]
MRKRLLNAAAAVTLLILTGLVIWQGSFNMGNLGPANVGQVYLYWAMSTMVFLLMVTLAFMLFRLMVKLYMERSRGQEGSHIRTKLVVGALLLSFLPVVFMVLWSYSVLNLNLKSWFSRPAENVKLALTDVGISLIQETQKRANAQSGWLAAMPAIDAFARGESRDTDAFEKLCEDNDIVEVRIDSPSRGKLSVCSWNARNRSNTARRVTSSAKLPSGGTLVVTTHPPVDLEMKERDISEYVAEYNQLGLDRQETRRFYLTYLTLITIFILFVATWVALSLARQITTPIAALLEAAREVRKGNLRHRVQVGAIDELAVLVRQFNEMTQDLESSSRELESRRRFTETILESIPTGVISVSSDGRVQTVNRALQTMFGADRVRKATRLEEIFLNEDAAELRYLMNRSRRTGVAGRQLDLSHGRKTLHLSVTVAPIDERATTGFVIVLEDTSELLRAQKSAAWHEVARRIAHEIKNPLTPISLGAERIARQLEKSSTTPEFARIVRDCTRIIQEEVQSVKTLVDEFAQFARFPAAQPAPSDLNEVIESALAVFSGRLEGITIYKALAPDLPSVNIDREQFKRVVVNLIDNAAEAMQTVPWRHLTVRTQSPTPEIVELVVADSGAGISPEDRDKLFLPYFSTKDRGTGLGLAIVSHILTEHGAQIRVEDNHPTGARFTIEIPAVIPVAANA